MFWYSLERMEEGRKDVINTDQITIDLNAQTLGVEENDGIEMTTELPSTTVSAIANLLRGGSGPKYNPLNH